MWIIFEGIDGSGKTSICHNLIKQKPNFFISLREPSESSWGSSIRKILTNKQLFVEKKEMLDLFWQDRLHNLSKNILPALEKKQNIIQDRYFFSTAAYQADDTKDALKILQMYLFDNRFLLPDYTFFINVDIEIALERISARKQKQEVFETKEKLKKTRQHYFAVFDYYKKFIQDRPQKKLYTIDGKKSIEEISQEVFSIVKL